MTEQDTPKMTHDEMIDTLKGLVFGTFDRTTAKEREALDMAISALSENKGDMVSRGVVEQIMWERDVAIEQLKDLGYCLGEKPRENKGEWIVKENNSAVCSKCNRNNKFYGRFCKYCGSENLPESEE